ncbi:MAG: recombinase family protein, partial [Alicyclobacillaceae bacterium]|nr:recombinase family protein [Alicyclobacillaceae bacterium]
MNYPENLKHVAIYLRKSRADMEAEARGEGETLAKHRKALSEIAKKYGYTIDHVYEEIVSGERISDRPEMQKLLESVKNGKYSAVLCMDIDRLGRGNLVDQGTIYEAFKSSKTFIITPRKVYDLEDEYDEEWTEFEAFMARRELKIITRRLQRGRRLSAREGKWVGKKPPYGYVRDENHRLHPDPDTAPIVRMIYEMRAQGMGRYKIARKLGDLGVPSPSGRPRWESVTVRDILDNEVYIGRIVWGQYKHFKDENGRKRKIKLPRDQWIVVENAHEPIIDLELWGKVQKMNDVMNPRTKIDYSLKNPLAGLIHCALC